MLTLFAGSFPLLLAHGSNPIPVHFKAQWWTISRQQLFLLLHGLLHATAPCTSDGPSDMPPSFMHIHVMQNSATTASSSTSRSLFSSAAASSHCPTFACSFPRRVGDANSSCLLLANLHSQLHTPIAPASIMVGSYGHKGHDLAACRDRPSTLYLAIKAIGLEVKKVGWELGLKEGEKREKREEKVWPFGFYKREKEVTFF